MVRVAAELLVGIDEFAKLTGATRTEVIHAMLTESVPHLRKRIEEWKQQSN